MRLTDQQRRAVRSWESGDICVVAGPGSGKTRVLVERVRWLVEDRKVTPERVLAITFTEKAAHEMTARLLGGAQGSPELRQKFESVRISTIDGFCNRLLREHALDAGVDPGFEMVGEPEAQTLLYAAINQVLDQCYRQAPEGVRTFLAAYVPSGGRSSRTDSQRLQDDLASLVTLIRSHGREGFLSDSPAPVEALAGALRDLADSKRLPGLAELADRLDEAPSADAATRASLMAEAVRATAPVRRSGRVKELVSEIKDRLLPACIAATAAILHRESREWLLRVTTRILGAFGEAKMAAGLLDFDDVLAGAAALLASESAPDMAFEHVLIDEFQDTNPLQIQLVENLLKAHGRNRPVRFVVGDINQSIYGFRHADQNVFREYRESLAAGGGEVIRLVENFRSRRDILEAVHRILPGGMGGGVEKHRLTAANRFPEKAEPSVEVHLVMDGQTSALEREAETLAGRLHELKETLRVADRQESPGGARPLEWGDVAVLVRTHERAARFAAALRRAGIPCRSASAARLFDAPETTELAAFLRVVRNPRDEISLAGTLKSPFCGVDDTALLRLRLGGGNLAEAISEKRANRAGLDRRSLQRLARFRELLAACRADRATVPPRFLLARAVQSCGYRSFLAARDEGPDRVANVDRLLQWIGRRQDQGSLSLDRISDDLDRAIQEGHATRDAVNQQGVDGCVEILTMHAAKGLEFPVVALASMQSPAAGRVPGMLFSAERGIGARWVVPSGIGPVGDAAYEYASRDALGREREESDRLLYVAMTRAEEHLVLSASFPKGIERRHWCKPVFDRLGIDTKADLPAAPEVRTAGDARYALRARTGIPGQPARSGNGERPGSPRILLPLAASAQTDYSATVTSITLFAQCPRRYYLARVLALNGVAARLRSTRIQPTVGPLDRDGTDASTFGSEVHLFLAGQLTDPGPAARRLAARFLEHELGCRSARAETVEREAGFAFTLGDRLLRGTLDLLFEEGGERVLVDYKTDRVRRGSERDAAQTYAAQLQLYAAGLAKAERPVDRAVIFYLRSGVPVDMDVGASAVESAAAMVDRFFEAQVRQDYPLRVGSHCLRCQYFRDACPARLA